MKRKGLLLFVVCLVIFIMAGCGGEENNTEEQKDPEPKIEEPVNIFSASDPLIDEYGNPYPCRVIGKVVDWFGNVDRSEKPVSSVEVLLDGTQHSVLTNSDGEYIIGIPDGAPSLQFSKKGYLPFFQQVTSGHLEPSVELNVRLKPVITGPVFQMTDRNYGGGIFQDVQYVEYEGLVYKTEHYSRISIGPANTIRAYDISDWYDVKFTDIEICPDENHRIGRMTVIDNELWSCYSGNWNDEKKMYTETIRRFALPDLEEIGFWDFGSNVSSSEFLVKKDGYIIELYIKYSESNQYLDHPEIRLKYLDPSDNDLKISSEEYIIINELSPKGYNTGFFSRGATLTGNNLQIILDWWDNSGGMSSMKNMESKISLNISNKSTISLISCNSKIK